MVDKHLIEEAYYLVAVGPETVKELGYKSMGIVFDIEIDPEMVIGHTGSPSKHDPFEEEEVEYLACEAEKADFTVTDIYWFEGGDEVAAAGKDLDYNGHKLAAKKVLDELLVLDAEFRAYVQGLIDARCDKIMAGKFDE